jgi:hypothetical protein
MAWRLPLYRRVFRDAKDGRRDERGAMSIESRAAGDGREAPAGCGVSGVVMILSVALLIAAGLMRGCAL